jgi:2-amino-4-hydroxy-6-hydroxymethyldihydropteridine diphosphokinase
VCRRQPTARKTPNESDNRRWSRVPSRRGGRWSIVYLALGTNQGDRWQNLRNAIAHLDGCVVVERTSDVYETEPAYVLDQPRYLNMVVQGRTDGEPRSLLRCLKELEQQGGRTTTRRWGERVIDLDILLYGDERIDEPELIIPHPRMHERQFVLHPLLELAPDLVIPGDGRTVRDLAATAPHGEVIARLGPLTMEHP